jgi:mono/diheme cytochrome c family protein
MRKSLALAFLIAATVVLTFVAAAQEQSVVNSASTATPAASTPAPAASTKTTPKSDTATSSKTSAIHVEPSLRIEGEKRFHANCSRCHVAPTKLPPRAAATIIRHMRVRATITDDDMRLILAYLTQ